MITNPNRLVVRKKLKDLSSLDDSWKFKILEDYSTGNFTWEELRAKYNLKSKKQLEEFVNKHLQKLNIVKETNSLDVTKENYVLSYTPNNLINEPFIEQLSPPTASMTELSDAEMTYCFIYVYAGDNPQAMKESGLDAGLEKYGIKTSDTYKNAIRTRGLFLRNKKNVSEYIHKLREEKLKLHPEVNKKFIVEELLEQLSLLKESGENQKLVLETIKMLGQTCHAFSEHITVSKIDPSKALDNLIELAQVAAVKELPPGSPVDEVWEVDS